MNEQLRIHLFGVPHLQSNIKPAYDLPTEKLRHLFYYLAFYHGAAHPRSVLQGLFWGDRPEARARHSLSTELWRLRRWIAPLEHDDAPLLSMQEGHVRLRLDGSWWLDTAEFEHSVRQAQQLENLSPARAADWLRRAVEAYSGDLLEGCYDEWCFAERERLHQTYLDALLKLLVYYGARREYALAIEFGQRLLRADPLQEQVHRELMKLYALNDQQPQALAQYQTCYQLLRQELGVEPDLETQAVMRQVIAGRLLATTPVGKADERAFRGSNAGTRRLAARVRAALEQIESARRELVDTLRALDELDRAAGNSNTEK